MQSKTAIELTSLGYSSSQARAIVKTAKNKVRIKIISGLRTSIQTGGKEQDAIMIVQAEKQRRGVRFLPRQVIRRMMEYQAT